MSKREVNQKNIEEFSRLQKYMSLIGDENHAAYKEMKWRYIELKTILTDAGVNLSELDFLKL